MPTSSLSRFKSLAPIFPPTTQGSQESCLDPLASIFVPRIRDSQEAGYESAPFAQASYTLAKGAGDLDPGANSELPPGHPRAPEILLGRKDLSVALINCIVVADSWPSWLVICTPLGMKCISVVVQDPALPSLQLLRKLYPEVEWNGYDDPRWRQYLDPECIVLGEGSSDRIKALMWETSFTSKVVWVCPGSSPADETKRWYQIEARHSLVGGALDGRWQARSNHPFPGTETRGGVQRRIRHYINEATRLPSRLWAAPGPDKEEENADQVLWLDRSTVDGRGLYPAGETTLNVRCRSVFTDTRWTVRPLDILELGGLYDVPKAVLQEWVKVDHLALDFARLDSPPTKILAWVFQHWSASAPPERNVPAADQRLIPPLTDDGQIDEVPVVRDGSAAKADDAEADKAIWDDRIWSFSPLWAKQKQSLPSTASPLDTIRAVLLARWRRRTSTEFTVYMRQRYGRGWATDPSAKRDREVGRSCLKCIAGADWWEWRLGSTLLFWRWPTNLIPIVRDGHPIWVKQPLPCYIRPQPGERDQGVRAKVASKLQNVVDKGYIANGQVESLTGYFSVPKGTSDIRIVYDATKSGLNAAIWVPSFALPSAESFTNLLEPGTWMMDLDLGEMFLNFPLDLALQPYCGVDLRPYLGQGRGTTLWMRWVRCMMGLMSSPYICVKTLMLGYEMVLGNRHDASNALRWASVQLNLPGSPTYTPTMPWVYKARANGRIAGGLPTFVDDLRPTGESEEECWKVGHQAGCRINHLGIQVTSRKMSPPSQTPGAWAGTIAHTGPTGVSVKVSQDKWDKARSYVAELSTQLASGNLLDRKSLEIYRGFFIHLQRTYPTITPFLKGLHLTIDGWRPGRDENMWKLPPSDRLSWTADTGWIPMPSSSPPAPPTVVPAPRLAQDMACLSKLFAPAAPPLRPVRPSSVKVAIYGFVDASGSGLGSSFLLPPNTLWFRHGVWGRDADSMSSNYRELRNLVDAVEAGVASGDLADAELFVFTDNSTAEGAYSKGNTDSPLLFDLVLRLRCLDMSGGLRLHVIHVAGTRMVAQGTDGLSRGDVTDGIMAGQPMCQFIPLHLPPTYRSPDLLNWIRYWCPDPTIRTLSPADWYEKGHGVQGGHRSPTGMWFPVECSDRWYLWDIAPAAAPFALEEALTSRLKRPHLNHIFLIPRLMTQYWRRKLHKVADVVLELPAGVRPYWPRSMHEPLLIGLTLSLLPAFPWELRSTPELLGLERAVRDVWRTQDQDERPLLCQLCLLPGVLGAV